MQYGPMMQYCIAMGLTEDYNALPEDWSASTLSMVISYGTVVGQLEIAIQ